MQRFPGKFRHTSVVFLSRNQDSDNVSVLWYSPCPVLLPPGFSPAPVSAPAAAPEYNKAGHLLMKDNRLPSWTASLKITGVSVTLPEKAVCLLSYLLLHPPFQALLQNEIFLLLYFLLAYFFFAIKIIFYHLHYDTGQ